MNRFNPDFPNTYRIAFILLFVVIVLYSKAVHATEVPSLVGKNVIFIHLESFQNFTIGQTLGGTPLTPNMNALVKQGLWFSRCYPQIAGGNTSDAEFMANTSLLPAATGAVFERFTSGAYHSIGNILKNKGYRTAVFHGNTAKVWNRPTMYPALGFERFDSAAQYARGLKIGLGLADRPFYAETAQKLLSIGEPFFAAVLSLSGHHPFKIPDSEDCFTPAPYTGTVLGDYLRAVHYADAALGSFIAELRRSGLLERSLVVIYGDHGGVPLSEYERLDHFLKSNRRDEWEDPSPNRPNPALWRERAQVPLLFLAEEAILASSVDVPVGQVDIASTVAGIMGIEMPEAVGTDLTRDTPPFVVFRDGSIIKGNLWITNITDNKALVYSLADGSLIFSGNDGRVLFSGTINQAIEMLRSSDRVLEQHR